MNISVIVPVYNVERYLKECLRSIYNQTIPFFEVILVDDGSTDNSSSICDEAESLNERTITIHKTNGGLSDARNVGIKTAKGDYIFLIDSDDTISSTTNEDFLNILNEYKNEMPELIVTNLKSITNNNSTVKRHYLSDRKIIAGPEYLKIEYKKNTMYMASVQCLYKRSFLLSHNMWFREGLLHEDELFTPVVFYKANSVLPTDLICYNHMIRTGSITTQSNKIPNAKSIIEICKLLNMEFEKISDKTLRRYVLEHAVDLYYKVFIDAELLKHKDIRISRKYLIKHSKSLKNRFRTLEYLISPSLLFFTERIRRRKSKMEVGEK